ncbi:hypothetical protein GRJ22_08035 [Photobacterium carnosum]|uniref:hypothetical protein n=1 Tax=Photobacterium carnosum TaxID=2023717 RepID=UPI001E35DC97|nr:hypothetical protein [Photobacterium carnosum]MCD9556386.1 hypothetical protein [Photobacterium carnosum]
MSDSVLLQEILKYGNILISPIFIAGATYWLKHRIDTANYRTKIEQDKETAKELRKLKDQLDDANFPDILSKLASTTELVETIQNEISNKSWINQQFFPIRQEIMQIVTKAITDLRELVYSRNQEHLIYHYIYYEHCGFSGGGFDVHFGVDPKYQEEVERMEAEYWAFAEKEIELEKSKHKQKYASPEYKKKDKLHFTSVISSIESVLNQISLNQAILSTNTVELYDFFEHAKDKLTSPQTFDYDEGTSEWEWSEYTIEENEKFLAEIDKQHIHIIELTKAELGFGE